jgi:glutamyl-tRNA synthetase
VVRGEDLLPAAVTQAYLTNLISHQPPIYAHVPLAVNVEGRRLAKRDGAVTLPELAADGMTPDAVLSVIAQSLELTGPGEPVSLDGMLERFDPGRLPREPWVVVPSGGLRSGT